MPKQKLSPLARKERYAYLRSHGVSRPDAIRVRDWGAHSYWRFILRVRFDGNDKATSRC